VGKHLGPVGNFTKVVMDKDNYTLPLSTQQLFIGLNKRSQGFDSSSIYVSPEDISLIEPSWGDGAFIRLRGVSRPFEVDESPDFIRGLIDGRIAAAQTVNEP
jgi:hypothetical protein